MRLANRFALTLLPCVFLAVGCSTVKNSTHLADAEDICRAYGLEQLAQRGTPVNIYKIIVTRKDANTVVEIYPPAMADDGYSYFGGGGKFVCDPTGKIISEQYYR